MRKTRSKELDTETISILNDILDAGEGTRFAYVEAKLSPATLRNAADGKGVRPVSYRKIMAAVQSFNKSKASA